MCLSRTRLAEGPTSFCKDRVLVAEIAGPNAPFGDFFDDLPKPCETVGCFRTSPRWYGKANWLAIDDWGWSLPSRTIKAFPAKDHSHSLSLVPSQSRPISRSHQTVVEISSAAPCWGRELRDRGSTRLIRLAPVLASIADRHSP